MDSSAIIGKDVVFYLDGGWQLSGKVKIFEGQKIIIENDGVLSIIMRDKVSCMSVVENAVAAKPARDYPINENGAAGVASEFPMNGISYEDSTLSIPSSLIGTKDEEEFSVFFGDNEADKDLSFGVENDTEEEA